MMDAGETFEDIDDDARSFLNFLVEHLKGNLVPSVRIDELKRQMEQKGISLEKLDTLVEVMKRHMALEYNLVGGESWITIHPDRVRGIQHWLKNNTCPECNKGTLTQKIVICCPECNYRRDKE